MALQAETSAFVMPPPGLTAPPGLETFCKAADGTVSPCSTAVPSPELGYTSPCFGRTMSPLSPSSDTEEPSRSRSESEDAFSLPENAVADEPYRGCRDAAAFEFKLTGMEELQSSLAKLLASMSTTEASEGSGTISPGRSEDLDQEMSSPQTPEVAEGQATFQPEPPQKKGWATAAVSGDQQEVLPTEFSQTSVNLQNLPKKYTRNLLAERLNEANFGGEYDLIYVVADLKQRNSGSGAALINFCSEEACARFTAAFDKVGVSQAFPGFAGKKAVEVTPASTQGLDANVQKLEKSCVLMSMLADRPGWQPARYNKDGKILAELGGC